jgi:hypothetical protein
MTDLDLVIPGESVEGRWVGTAAGMRGHVAGLLQIAADLVRVSLTSVLEERARRLTPGTYVRVVYEGLALTATGRLYRRHRIEELFEPPD